MRLEWEQDLAWADGFRSRLEAIVAGNAGRIVSIRRASEEEDQHHATDCVVTVETGEIALRVRRPNCAFRDLTLRFRRRPWGALALDPQRGYEVDKILGGFARWYLYAWTTPAGGLSDWLLVDLDILRSSGLLEQVLTQDREQWNRDCTTSFTWLTYTELVEVGAVVNSTLERLAA